MIDNEIWINSIYSKKMKNIKYGFWIALIIFIVGVALGFYGKSIGIGLVIGAIGASVVTIIRWIRIINDKMQQTEDKIKKLQEEIELLKKK